MKVVQAINEMREALVSLRSGTIGLVPTMGALHDGHRSLLDAARTENATVVMSLFVNPAQFSEESDLVAYPRDDEHDLALAAEAGVNRAANFLVDPNQYTAPSAAQTSRSASSVRG